MWSDWLTRTGLRLVSPAKAFAGRKFATGMKPMHVRNDDERNGTLSAKNGDKRSSRNAPMLHVLSLIWFLHLSVVLPAPQAPSSAEQVWMPQKMPAMTGNVLVTHIQPGCRATMMNSDGRTKVNSPPKCHPMSAAAIPDTLQAAEPGPGSNMAVKGVGENRFEIHRRRSTTSPQAHECNLTADSAALLKAKERLAQPGR